MNEQARNEWLDSLNKMSHDRKSEQCIAAGDVVEKLAIVQTLSLESVAGLRYEELRQLTQQLYDVINALRPLERAAFSVENCELQIAQLKEEEC
jgi:hypothetical protein